MEGGVGSLVMLTEISQAATLPPLNRCNSMLSEAIGCGRPSYWRLSFRSSTPSTLLHSSVVQSPRVGIQTPHLPDRLGALVPMLPRVCVVLVAHHSGEDGDEDDDEDYSCHCVTLSRR